MAENRIRVGITQGDINGIGCETIIKTLADPRVCEMYTVVVYGSSKAAAVYKKFMPEAEQFSFNRIDDVSAANPRRANIINCVDDNRQVTPGESTVFGGQAALAALNTAVKDLKAGKIDVLVTSPIDKANIHGDQFGFMGHTEFLDAEFHDTEPLMMMVGEEVKVGLATIHIPVAEIASQISTEVILKKLRALKRSLVRDFGIVQPRIAVFGLNPHAGDNGLTGSEEETIIKPALVTAADEGILAFGPFAADGFFGAGNFRKYDAVLAMYHDQGLAPFKAITGESGVNFTAGLTIVRTSPAHGVGYDIAGKNLADESSLRAAIYTAVDVFRNRNIYNEMSANPLQHYKTEGGRDMSAKDLPEPAEV